MPIWGVTVQNEPMALQRWDSCLYSAEEERDFVRDQPASPQAAEAHWALGAIALRQGQTQRGRHRLYGGCAAQLLARLGSGFDIVSGGELARVLAAV